MQEQKVKFIHFLEKFPEIELPITLSDESQLDFSRNNQPFHPLMINQFILPIEGIEMDEFTEYIPCFKIPKTFDIHAVVFWKATLMNYQYHLVTFDKKGNLLDKAVIAGTYSDGEVLVQSVATIEDDWIIYIVSGKSDASSDNTYDASKSQTFNLELLADGKIITSD